jgi:hypothetical protein
MRTWTFDAERVVQNFAPIFRKPVPQNLMMTSLYYVDRADPDAAEVFDRQTLGLRPEAERRGFVIARGARHAAPRL